MRVFNRYFSAYDVILLIGDLIVTFLTTAGIQTVVLLANISSAPEWAGSSLHGMAVTVIVIVSFYYCDLYAIDQTLSLRELLLRLMSGIGSACVMIGLVSYPIPQFGKTVYASEIILLSLGLCGWRVGFMRVIEKARVHAKVLLIGVHSIGKLVTEELHKHKKLGMEVVGFVGDGPGQLTMSYGNPVRISLPVFQPSSLLTLVEEKRVGRILLSGVESTNESLARDLVFLRARGIPIEDCHSFYERLVSKIAITDLSPYWLMRTKGFRRDRLVTFTKRVIDMIASAAGLLLSAPILAVTAAAIKLDTPGPLLYLQQRVGQNEKRFTIYKFRSMSENAEANGPVWAARNDPRVTRVGRWIRKLRIDEIPQMVNVLKGDMSFVGPRPERPFFVETLNNQIPYYSLRHSVKPGITGWAQICCPYGDSEEGAIEKLQYDLYYIKHMSMLFDLQIIFESLKVILLGRGAR